MPITILTFNQVALLFASSTSIAITSFISPYKADRDMARELHKKHNPELPFVEVFVDTSVEECAKRDPKGLYKKAMSGEIKGMLCSFHFVIMLTHLRIYWRVGSLRSPWESGNSYPGRQMLNWGERQAHCRLPFVERIHVKTIGRQAYSYVGARTLEGRRK